MEDIVKKMRRKAQGDIISELVKKKKHAKNGKRIESNTYTVANQALSAIDKTVTKGALYTVITREYTNRYGNSSPPVSLVAVLLPSSPSALTSHKSSSSSESTSNDNYAGLKVTLAAAALKGDRGLAAAALTLAAAAITPSNDNDNTAGSNEEDRVSAAAKTPRDGRPKGTTNKAKAERRRKRE